MNGLSEAVFFAVALVLTLFALNRELPAQYVFTVALIAGSLSALGCLFINGRCWWLPLIVLNSRGLSRFALYQWHERAYYGWGVIGLTCVFSTLLTLHWSTPIAAFTIQMAALPWLIKRRPGRETPHIFPVVLWLLMGAFLIFNRAPAM